MHGMQGGDLFDEITRSVKYAEPQAAKMITDLAEALFYLHSRNIVHRDLKPENILVRPAVSVSLSVCMFGCLSVHTRRLPGGWEEVKGGNPII